MKTALVIFLMWALIGNAASLKCYRCAWLTYEGTEYGSAACGIPFRANGTGVYEEYCRQNYQCRKETSTIPGSGVATQISRSCTPFCEDKCMDGTLMGKPARICSSCCTDDLCNHAQPLRLSLGAVIALVTATILTFL